MKIALVSLNQVWEDKKANLLSCKAYIEQASLNNVDLIIFPEMTLSGFSSNTELLAENELSSETINSFSSLAKEFSIAIVFGLIIQAGDKCFNKSCFIDDTGKVLGNYAKIHPFTFSGEDKYFKSGCNLTVVKYKQVNIGLTICYDLRFPELYSALSKSSDIIINIANWPEKRIDHWNTLLKARAIENQIYIIGVNRIGTDANQLKYVDSSNIINANGDYLDFQKIEDMKIYSIDTLFTQKYRANFNTINDRKVNFYKEIL